MKWTNEIFYHILWYEMFIRYQEIYYAHMLNKNEHPQDHNPM